MTAPHYAGWFRYVDHRGVLHLATASMPLGVALCGHPPVGVEMSDPFPSFYPPFSDTRHYGRVCESCNDGATGGGSVGTR